MEVWHLDIKSRYIKKKILAPARGLHHFLKVTIILIYNLVFKINLLQCITRMFLDFQQKKMFWKSGSGPAVK